MNAIVPIGGNALIPQDMRSAMDLATMMSKGKLVPQHLQEKPGDCLMVIECAMRWGMSPFAVAQETAVISGKLMHSGKLVSAAVQSSGVLAGRLRYDFEGEGESRAVVVTGTLKGEAEPRTIRCTLKEGRTSNQMWTKQPDQQLVYFGTRAWARRHTPEVMLGVYSPEEFDEQPTPRDNFTGQTIDAQPEEPRQPVRIDQVDKDAAIKRWLDKVAVEFAACSTFEDVEALKKRDDVARGLSRLTGEHKETLADIISDAVIRIADPDAEGEPVDGE